MKWQKCFFHIIYCREYLFKLFKCLNIVYYCVIDFAYKGNCIFLCFSSGVSTIKSVYMWFG